MWCNGRNGYGSYSDGAMGRDGTKVGKCCFLVEKGGFRGVNGSWLMAQAQKWCEFAVMDLGPFHYVDYIYRYTQTSFFFFFFFVEMV